MPSQTEKAQRFAALHQREGVIVIPNPWDAASANVPRIIQMMMFVTLLYRRLFD